MPKKYFWIKLKDNFFKQLAIKKLRKVAGGDTFVIIYLKMMLLSMNNEGKIAFECSDGSEFAENLALELDEQEDNVDLTLAFLKNNNLIEFLSDAEAYLPEVKDCIGCESDSAERVRKYRQKAKTLQCNNDVTDVLQECTENVTLDIRDKRIDKDIDITTTTKENSKDSSSGSYNLFSEIEKALGVTLTELQAEKFKTLYDEVGETVFTKALNVAADKNVRHYKYVESTARNIAAGNDFDDKPQSFGAIDVAEIVKRMKD